MGRQYHSHYAVEWATKEIIYKLDELGKKKREREKEDRSLARA